MHVSCMATKTISLEIDAYERLRAAKKAGESFSAVVRRAVFPEEPPTGASLLRWSSGRKKRVRDGYLNAVEEAVRSDLPPEDPWT